MDHDKKLNTIMTFQRYVAKFTSKSKMAEHVRLKLDKSELLCKNGCGFFGKWLKNSIPESRRYYYSFIYAGNPEWAWYCSKCWRQHNGAKQLHSFNFDSAPVGGAAGGPGTSQSLPAALNKEKSSPFQSLIKKSPVAGPETSSKKSSAHSSLSQKFSTLEDRSRKHVQTLERKTSNMTKMFMKGKGRKYLH